MDLNLVEEAVEGARMEDRLLPVELEEMEGRNLKELQAEGLAAAALLKVEKLELDVLTN